MLIKMPGHYTIQRYASFFKGWCQAFGEHESINIKNLNITLLSGDMQVGLILPADDMKLLQRQLLGKHRRTPHIIMEQQTIKVGSLQYIFDNDLKTHYDLLIDFVTSENNLHLFLTYHFMYPSGTRILTIAGKQPLNLMYKGIDTIELDVID